jgi:hypothetical protein
VDERTAVIDRGLSARFLLTNDTFNRVMTGLAAEQEQTITQSEPHESKKRESAYFQHRALQAICNTLIAWVQIGEAAQEEVEQGTETE